MEDRLLKFAKIVDADSFTRAAISLHVSQPALTTAVKKLERELQAELLIRGSHHLRLTAAGQLAYESARLLSLETSNLRTRLQEQAQQKVTLNIGAIDSVATMLFVEGTHLSELERQAQVSLTVDNSSRLIHLVAGNELDIALVARPQQLRADLHVQHIGQEPLIFVARGDIKRQVRAEMSKGRLHTVMSYNQASHTHMVIAEHFAQTGIELLPNFYSTSPEVMLQLARAGRGAAVLPYLLVKPYLSDGTLEPVALSSTAVIQRAIVSIQRTGHMQSTAAKTMLKHSREQLLQLQHETARL